MGLLYKFILTQSRISCKEKMGDIFDILRNMFDILSIIRAEETVMREANLETVFLTQSMLNKYISRELQPGELLDFAHKTMEIQLSGKVDRMLDRAVEIAKENGVLVADCHKKWKRLEALGADTTDYLVNHINHPNRQMHWLFADTLFDTVIF